MLLTWQGFRTAHAVPSEVIVAVAPTIRDPSLHLGFTMAAVHETTRVVNAIKIKEYALRRARVAGSIRINVRRICIEDV